MSRRSLFEFFSRIWCHVAMLGVCAAWAGCTEPVERTQVVVVIDAEESLRSRIRYVDVEVRGGPEDEPVWPLQRSERLIPRGRESGWPLELRLTRPAAGFGYFVTAQAKAADDSEITTVRAKSEYAKGRTLELRLRFDEACATRSVKCPTTFSCREGMCIDPFVPTDELAAPDEPVAESDVPPASDPTQMPGQSMAGSDASACTGPSCGRMMMMGGACSGANCPPACAVRDEKGVCQDCPKGFLASAANGCTPALTELELVGRTELEPAFDPATTTYLADLPLLVAKATLRLVVAPSVELLVNGAPMPASSEWVAPLELGDNTFMITLNAVGHPSRTYRVTLKRGGSQLQKLTPKEGKPGDLFGAGLAATETRVVVGAPNEDGAAADSGAVYVFERTSSGWVETAYLKAEQPRAGAHFGHSVAIDGDRLAVAAPEDSGGGAIYVFEHDGSEWMRVKTLRELPGSLLGRGLALQGDLLAVGAPGEQASNRESGCVFVYARGATGWERAAMLVQGDPGIQDWTGSSVAMDGDTIVTGSTGRTLPGQTIFSGAVYAFQREASSWRELPLIAPTQPEPGAFFGETVAISKDLLATAGFFSNVGLTAGTAYVFRRGSDGKFSEESVLRPKNSRGGDWFGTRVAVAGETVLVGAARESSAVGGVGAPGTGMLENSGALYLFERDGDTWQQTVEIKSDAPAKNEEFGRHVAVAGEDLLISAPADAARDGKSMVSGSVYVFR